MKVRDRDAGGHRVRMNPVLGCLAVKERRASLEALLTWGSPQPESRLAAYLAANELGTPSIDETEIEPIHAALIHSHLPALEDAGLIEWERDQQLIETTDHPALSDPRLHRLITIESPDVEGVFRVLAHEDRRIALTVLRDSDSPLTREELAREVEERQGDEVRSTLETTDGALPSLYHVHLPKLSEAGCIEIDHGTGRIQYVDHPTVEEVFAIMLEPDEELAKKLAGFFEGLESSLGVEDQGPRCELEWPGFWSPP